MHPYITVFTKQIPVYGICFFAGIIASAVAALFIQKKKSVERYDLAYSAVYTMIGAMIGSKLLFVLVSYKQIMDLGLGIEAVIKGGFVFYGGLIGGAAGLFIYCKQFKLQFSHFSDIYVTVLPIGHAIGRLGCFFGGCCYGIPYSGPFSVTYAESADFSTPLNTPLFPVQLFEAAVLVILFICFVYLYHKNAEKRGLQTILYALSYSVIRFSLELLRGDSERGKFLYLSTSQWVSILIFAVSMLLFVSGGRKIFRDQS